MDNENNINNLDNINMEELNKEISSLRKEINQKMDSYFILENREIYNSMMNYKEKNKYNF